MAAQGGGDSSLMGSRVVGLEERAQETFKHCSTSSMKEGPPAWTLVANATTRRRHRLQDNDTEACGVDDDADDEDEDVVVDEEQKELFEELAFDSVEERRTFFAKGNATDAFCRALDREEEFDVFDRMAMNIDASHELDRVGSLGLSGERVRRKGKRKWVCHTLEVPIDVAGSISAYDNVRKMRGNGMTPKLDAPAAVAPVAVAPSDDGGARLGAKVEFRPRKKKRQTVVESRAQQNNALDEWLGDSPVTDAEGEEEKDLQGGAKDKTVRKGKRQLRRRRTTCEG